MRNLSNQFKITVLILLVAFACFQISAYLYQKSLETEAFVPQSAQSVMYKKVDGLYFEEMKTHFPSNIALVTEEYLDPKYKDGIVCIVTKDEIANITQKIRRFTKHIKSSFYENLRGTSDSKYYYESINGNVTETTYLTEEQVKPIFKAIKEFSIKKHKDLYDFLIKKDLIPGMGRKNQMRMIKHSYSKEEG